MKDIPEHITDLFGSLKAPPNPYFAERLKRNKPREDSPAPKQSDPQGSLPRRPAAEPTWPNVRVK